MTRAKVIRVVVCAGGLGTRIAGWARYIPRGFYPVEGWPGMVHLLEEISALGSDESSPNDKPRGTPAQPDAASCFMLAQRATLRVAST